MDHKGYIGAAPKIEVHGSPLSFMDKSSSLQAMIERQAKTLEELRKDALGDNGDASKSNETDTQSTGWHERFELASGHVWSDFSDDDTSLPAVPPGSDVHDSIEAIREEASRVDAAIALDQLDTAQDEVASLKKELITRESEIKGLHRMLHATNEKVASLELQRDLSRAENAIDDSSEGTEAPSIGSPTSRAESCTEESEVSKLRKRYQALALLDETTQGKLLLSQSEDTPPRVRRSTSLLPSRNHLASSAHSSSFGIAPRTINVPSTNCAPHMNAAGDSPAVPPSQSIGSSPSHESWTSHNSRGIMDAHSRRAVERDASMPVRRSHQIHHEPRTPVKHSFDPPYLRSFTPSTAETLTPQTPVAEARRLTTPESHGSPYLLVPNRQARPSPLHLHYGVPPLTTPATTQSAEDPSLSSRNPGRRTNEVFRMDGHDEALGESRSVQSRRTSSHVDISQRDPMGTGTKSCLSLPKLFLRRNKKKQARKKGQTQCTPYQAQASEMNQLYRTSYETSEELRKRLAMIMAYYEEKIEELRHELALADRMQQKKPAKSQYSRK